MAELLGGSALQQRLSKVGVSHAGKREEKW